MRKRLFEIVEVGKYGDRLSALYDAFMILVIFVSIVPLLTHTQTVWTHWINTVTTVIFVVDYLLRLITADFRLGMGRISFFKYPLTGMAIVDLISILPSLTFLIQEFRLLRVVRLIWTLRTLRIFLLFRYSRNIRLVGRVIRRERDSLLAVCSIAATYIAISSIVIFNAEPETFPSMFDAVYWSVTSLTTVGYGDIYPVTRPGKVISMLSSVMGIAVLAMPTGIITSGFLAELKNEVIDIDERKSWWRRK